MNLNDTTPPEEFDFEDGYARLHPTGKMSLQEAVDRVCAAIDFCRDKGVGRLLMDGSLAGGFPAPSVVERYWIARAFADKARARVTVSFVLQPYLLDPARFGVTVAANYGMRTNAFATVAEALPWLLNQPDPANPRSPHPTQ